MRRRWAAPLVILSVSVLFAGIWKALDTREQDQSRADRSARVAVTAAVERRPLESSIVVRASVEAADPVAVAAPPRSEGQAASVVTAAPPATGTNVEAGRSVIEINGRPVLLLAMSVPLYRDIVPGTTGPDVASLQSELTRLGLDVSSDAAGQFGPATQTAVGGLFERAGYEPGYVAGSRAEFDAGLAATQQKADDALTAANRSRAEGVADPDLDAAYTAARGAVTAFRESQGVELRSSETARVPKDTAVIVGAVPASGDMVDPGKTILTLASPEPRVTIALAPAQEPQVTPKSAVSVTGSGFTSTCTPGSLVAPPTTPATGTVDEGTNADGAPSSSDGADTGSELGGAGEIAIELACDPKPALASIGGNYTATVKTKIAIERLVVPATAVVSHASGSASVDRATGSNRFERVPIVVKAEAGGFVSIEAPEGGLGAGDRVRVRRS